MNIEEINARKTALKNTIESMSRSIRPLQKELDELEKLTKTNTKKENK